VLLLVAAVAAPAVSNFQTRRGERRANTEAVNARRQEQTARTQAARSEAVNADLQDMLKSAGPAVARRRDATLLREVLDRTARRLETDLADQSEVRGDLWTTLASTHQQIRDRLA
jgi:eukaryotic-like serine/threonine-protein kinase